MTKVSNLETPAGEWNTVLAQYDDEGNIKCATYSKDMNEKHKALISLKINIKMNTVEGLKEIADALEETRSEYPFTDIRFDIDLR